MANRPIFDIYIRNISIVDGNRLKTMNELFVFINKCLIQDKLDNRLGLLDNLKVPEMCRHHDGNTYIAFCRFEKPNMHCEAAEYISKLIFYGRQLLARVNDIESGVAQWSTVRLQNEDGTPIWYHGEKAKLLNSINKVVESNGSEVEELKRQLEHETEMKEMALNKITTFSDELCRLNNKYLDKLEENERIIGELRAKLAKYELSGHSGEPSN